MAKAYVTRVGEGPFPTEIDGHTPTRLRELGGEYGTRPGARGARVARPRRASLRRAHQRLTALALTKLDVLSGFERLCVCTRYRGPEGAEFNYFPYHQTMLHHAAGEYVEMAG